MDAHETFSEGVWGRTEPFLPDRSREGETVEVPVWRWLASPPDGSILNTGRVVLVHADECGRWWLRHLWQAKIGGFIARLVSALTNIGPLSESVV